MENAEVRYEYEEGPYSCKAFSVVQTSWGGPARNFICEEKTRAEAEAKVERVKKLVKRLIEQ